MEIGKWSMFWLLMSCVVLVVSQNIREYSMDEFATCGRTLNVDDGGIRLIGRGTAAPSNPPLECIVYLQSVYSRDDGSNKLQIKVESLNIEDCTVKVDLYNGRASVGQTLQALSCQHGSTDLIYSQGRMVTVKFSRPDRIIHNQYQFTLEIKPYKDQDVPGTKSGVDALSVGAIIGIIIGCLVLIGLVIFFLWCCCTGRLGNFNVPGMSLTKATAKEKDTSKIISEKSRPAGAINFQDPVVWNTVTTGKYDTQQSGPRLYQRGAPRNAGHLGRRFDYDKDRCYQNERDGLHRSYTAARDSQNRRSGHEYEQYENERRQNQVELENRKNTRKETLIDDVFDSDAASKATDQTGDTGEDSTLQTRSPKGSPKTKKKDSHEIPEEKAMDKGSPQMERYLSMDLQSQPESDTISSPLHVNGGIRSSVEDGDELPRGSLRRKGSKSPKAKHRKDGKEPDPMALPPEAYEPIFTKPISGIDYRGNQPQFGAPPGYPGGFIPYGLIPAGAFAPGPPGSQTYAYAYQTVQPGGVPGQPYKQGAVFMQNTPTNDGNRRTAFAVEETVSPNKSKMTTTPESHRRKHSDPFRRTPYHDSGRSRQIVDRIDDSAPDFSVIARGAAPPDPGQSHRSISMKSGTDPKTGIHTTQVVWTDTVADPTDPKPDENPQITRKTITRVTTKSGYGEIPPQTMLLDQEEEPAFLAPSSSLSAQKKAIMPATHASSKENIAFYTGDAVHHTVPPPERSSTPTSVHHAPSYSHAIRDRIPLDDSTV